MYIANPQAVFSYAAELFVTKSLMVGDLELTRKGVSEDKYWMDKDTLTIARLDTRHALFSAAEVLLLTETGCVEDLYPRVDDAEDDFAVLSNRGDGVQIAINLPRIQACIQLFKKLNCVQAVLMHFDELQEQDGEAA
ncbi:hypothetical protein [Pontibacter sp. JAM-7]|uniref:hypothetical protein n=1 Tax=Pontibacter sp. JAM-7 TaxID=3366581 RepID=UPI003AF7CD4E